MLKNLGQIWTAIVNFEVFTQSQGAENLMSRGNPSVPGTVPRISVPGISIPALSAPSF